MAIGLNGYYDDNLHVLEHEIIEDCYKKYYSVLYKKKSYRLWLDYHRKIKGFIRNLNVYYCTFTFNDEKIFNDIKSFFRYLKRHGVKSYKMNYDLGEEKGRLHLHGFLCSDKKFGINELNLYGWTKLININRFMVLNCSDDWKEEEERIINYITNYVLKNDYFSKKVFTTYIHGIYNDIGSTAYNIY